MNGFEKLLNEMSQEISCMAYSFKTYRTIQHKGDKKILNSDMYFWTTVMESLLAQFFISFAKVFENGKKVKKGENLSIYFLLNLAKKNISDFSKEALSKRKKDSPNYAENTYELLIQDIKDIEEKLELKNDLIGNIRKYRHTNIAHKDIKNIFTRRKIGVTFDKAWEIICLAKKIEIFLFEAFLNGRKFGLTNKKDFQNYCLHAGTRKFPDKYDQPTIDFISRLTLAHPSIK